MVIRATKSYPKIFLRCSEILLASICNTHHRGCDLLRRLAQNPRWGLIGSERSNGTFQASVQTRQLLSTMDDNTSTLKSLMESIISRLDEQKVDSDKRLEAQAAFNAQVSQDLRALSKQVDLTQADVDDRRKALARSPSPR